MTDSPRLFARRRSGPKETERQELMASLARTRTLINQAYGGFNTVSDSDLIESYVFEINALHARYNYLLRKVKELEAVAQKYGQPRRSMILYADEVEEAEIVEEVPDYHG